MIASELLRSSIRMRSSSKALPWLILISTLVVACAALIQLSAGSYEMTASSVLAAFLDPVIWTEPATLGRLLLGDALADSWRLPAAAPMPTETLIIWNVRMPRVLTAILVGINLSISGCIFQAVTRNEMASPYLLGVSSGAGLAALSVLILFPALGAYLPMFAMLGGAGAFLIVYAIAWNRGTSPVRLVLAGIIVGAIAASIQTALFFLAKDINVVQNALAWTTGSLTGAGWIQVRQVAPWTVVSGILAFLGARHLDILQLGDASARSLGMHVERTRFLLAATAIMAAGSAVAVGGLIGFVGLIVPHVVRNLVGSAHHSLLRGCIFAGPALLVTADTAARLIVRPAQLPVGILTGCLGGVFFLYLMRTRREVARL